MFMALTSAVEEALGAARIAAKTTSCPLRQATWTGVLPSMSTTEASAPESNRCWTTARCPEADAACNGVIIILSLDAEEGETN